MSPPTEAKPLPRRITDAGLLREAKRVFGPKTVIDAFTNLLGTYVVNIHTPRGVWRYSPEPSKTKPPLVRRVVFDVLQNLPDVCDECRGHGFYFINGQQRTCICSEPQE